MTDLSSTNDSPNRGPTPLVLASASPRRKDLLALTGLWFEAHPIHIDESSFKSSNSHELALELANAKADKAILEHSDAGVILAADTVVILEGDVLGKPKDKSDAIEMLERLRSCEHEVVTSLVVMDLAKDQKLNDTCRTMVPMRDYSNEEIASYVASGSPMDKAGAYGIQDASPGVVNTGALHGCFANVMGLPLCHFTRTMSKLERAVKSDIPTRCQLFTGYDCPVFEAVLTGEI